MIRFKAFWSNPFKNSSEEELSLTDSTAAAADAADIIGDTGEHPSSVSMQSFWLFHKVGRYLVSFWQMLFDCIDTKGWNFVLVVHRVIGVYRWFISELIIDKVLSEFRDLLRIIGEGELEDTDEHDEEEDGTSVGSGTWVDSLGRVENFGENLESIWQFWVNGVGSRNAGAMKVMSLENLAWFGTWDKFASILRVNKNYEIVQILSWWWAYQV